MAKIAVAYCLHDDFLFLRDSLASFAGAGDAFVFVNDLPWAGAVGDWRGTADIARETGATVVEGSWPAEVLHRQGALVWLKERGYTHALLPEPDEVVEPVLLDSLVKVARAGLAERVHVESSDYWKRPDVVVRSRERIRPTLMVEIDQVCILDGWAIDGRIFYGGRPLFLSIEHGTLHRLSFVGPDERIRRRVQTWSGPGAVASGWWGNLWKAWDDDGLIRGLHPTLPGLFEFAEHIPLPSALAGIEGFDAPTAATANGRVRERPSVGAIVAVRDDPEGLATCVRGLEESRDLVHEIAIVDAGSTDETPEIARLLPQVRTFELDAPASQGEAWNAGVERTNSPLVLLLSPGTTLPRVSLEAMVDSLLSSGTVAAVGPLSNEGRPTQRIDPTYTSMDTFGLFADDLAGRPEDDTETDALDDGCLLVRRSALTEVGLFDTSSGLGDCETEELCHRIRKAGYRLLVSKRSYAHRHRPYGMPPAS